MKRIVKYNKNVLTRNTHSQSILRHKNVLPRETITFYYPADKQIYNTLKDIIENLQPGRLADQNLTKSSMITHTNFLKYMTTIFFL